MSNILYIARHAEPQLANARKVGLTPNGRKQAQGLAKNLAKAINSDSVSITLLHSQSQRCCETASIIAGRLGVITEEAPLRFANVEKLKVTDVQSKYTAYMQNFQKLDIESPEEYTNRLLKIVKTLKTEITVVIGNEVNIRVLLQILGGNTYNKPIGYIECYRLVIGDKDTKVAIERIV